MSPSYLMALDCGSGGVKCFLVDLNGKIVSQSSVEWLRDDWNTEIGWKSISEAIKTVISTARIDADQIAGVSTTSMREEFILLDDSGHEIQYKITPDIYPHGDRLNERYGEEMYRLSGHWPVPGWIAAAKMTWLNDTKPQVLKRAKLFLMISDWAGYRLGDTPYTEGSSACETSLFDVEKGDWSWKLLDELGLPKAIFPEVKPNGSKIATVTSHASKDTGLVEGTPVVIGGADTQCGLLGCGAINEGDIVAVGGTTTPIQLVINKTMFDVKRRTWTNMHLTKGRWIIESNAGRTGWVYRWFRDNIIYEKPSGKEYEAMNKIAEASPPGSNGLLAYLGPHIFKSGPPYWEGDRLGDLSVPPTLIGSAKFTLGDLARAIIEANCYAVRANAERLTEVTGLNVKKMEFCGGNSKSPLWMNIQANILGKPVVIPRERDATAVGAAICASVGAEIYESIPEAMKYMVHMEEPIIPNPELTKNYDQLYKVWMETRRRLSGVL